MKSLKILAVLFIIALSGCKTTKYPDLKDGLYADIETEKGDILLELYYETVPITCANFVSLAEGNNPKVNEQYKNKPFYDGLKFHRVVANFMIQGGDPLGTGAGGPGYKFHNEHPVSQDGKEIYEFDKAGVLAMANAGRDTNGAQFFITHNEYPSLNGGYTIFGQLVKGQNVVDSIAKDDVMKKVSIIRVGSEAKKFDAPEVFNNYAKEIEKKAQLKREQIEKLKADFLNNVEENKLKAKELPSGLKMYITKEGSGIKPKKGTQVRLNYSGYFTDGNLFGTSIKELDEAYGTFSERKEIKGAYNPFTMIYGPEADLIPGFREGMLLMNYGDKAMLFIPSHLGYGSEQKGPIPPNSDLIFEVHLVDESQDENE